jgi:hypothetical protein
MKGVKLKGLRFPNPSGTPEELTARKLVTDSIAHRLAMFGRDCRVEGA